MFKFSICLISFKHGSSRLRVLFNHSEFHLVGIQGWTRIMCYDEIWLNSSVLWNSSRIRKEFTLPFFAELAVSRTITEFNIVNTPKTHSEIADTVLSLGEIIITNLEKHELKRKKRMLITTRFRICDIIKMIISKRDQMTTSEYFIIWVCNNSNRVVQFC